MRVKIKLDTGADAQEFSKIAETIDGTVVIKDNNGLCVNAKSIIGALHALEFDELWCESDREFSHKIMKFIV